jgi:hypothetical protein
MTWGPEMDIKVCIILETPPIFKVKQQTNRQKSRLLIVRTVIISISDPDLDSRTVSAFCGHPGPDKKI